MSLLTQRVLEIDGVTLADLAPHADHRGQLTEIFRQSWLPDTRFVQWNLVHSQANTLRGVHLHVRHADYLTVVANRMIIGLKDMRRDSASFERECCVELRANVPRALFIPTGVAHGFWFPEPATYLYSVSEYFNHDDELAVRWDDPALGMFDRNLSPILSDRDKAAGDYASLLAAYESQLAAEGTP
jgi:dTDP-4-dehydrorhamnose 3,5-epimerase